MIGQVFTVVGISDEIEQLIRDIVAGTRALDGCEGIVVLRDTGSGDGLAVALWRDQAASDAAGPKIGADIDKARSLGANVTLTKAFDTAISV